MNVQPLPMLNHVDPALSWPELMATCERLGIPALRVDEDGTAWLLRTVADLDDWEEDA